MADITREEGYKTALERIEEATRIGATSLDLSGLGLHVLPSEISRLKGRKKA